jgi:Anti-sigma factor NepR
MVKSGSGSRGKHNNEGQRMRTAVEGGSGRGKGVDPKIQQAIGKHLRTVYDDVINEPVPDKFMELLEKLERSTARKT